jgi:hypothetical protein
MREINQEQGISPDIDNRANALFCEMRSAISRRTDKLFACLMVFQWLAGIVAALLLSPTAWPVSRAIRYLALVVVLWACTLPKN